jgi:hexosaminidase
MPSHVMAAIASYPFLSCKQKQIPAPYDNVWPITENFCAGNDSVFQFLEDVLTETMELFPSKYIHIGGDEADLTNWKTCPKCQARMKVEKLDSVGQLQSYFIKRIERFLISKGRKLVGWEEILRGGLAPEATVTSWLGIQGGIEAAKLKHDVIMAPYQFLYFDMFQADPKTEPKDIAPPFNTYGKYVPLIKSYSFDPVPTELNAADSKYIIGVEACVWSEYIPTTEYLEYNTIPRIFAVSEIGWSVKEKKNWDDFLGRTNVHLLRMKELHYNYSATTLKAPYSLVK